MKKLVNLFLAVALASYPVNVMSQNREVNTDPSQEPLERMIQRSYGELLDFASKTNVSDHVIELFEKRLEEEKSQREEELERKKEAIEDAIEHAQRSLKSLNRASEDSVDVDERRHALHCRIQNRRHQLRDTTIALEKGIEHEYDNKIAKLHILRDWPEEYEKTQQMLQQNRAIERKFGDFRDVGFRGGVFEDQQEDVKDGRDAVDELKRRNMLPPEVEDEEINSYIDTLAKRIARNSDLRVPLKVTLLKSKEINAFALPGGFLFVNTGLLEKAGNESELAGVIAHEIAHVAARHGDRLMGKANIANIIFQAAQVAALILTGGASSLLTYYLLQYGFYGLGLVLSLSLLGVSRDFEIEADILGTQYLWHANYNTRGFIDFFERMAREKGYVTGLSWFRTHPPFAERMTETYKEIVSLPSQEEPRVDSDQFGNMKTRLDQILKDMEGRDENAPTLRRVYECDDVALKPLKYE
jgi:hypothetical protein